MTLVVVCNADGAVSGAVHAKPGGQGEPVSGDRSLLYLRQELCPSGRSVCLLHPVIGGHRVCRVVSR